ncbi:uncharacterized protein [Onthophagus taurus]|uniref:uncharacterized protein isoform X2 n=1 Tax=Onthophagus taurus TaxID=166361 RepID=UPI0039BE43D4
MEDLVTKAIRARRRFRALVNMVINNLEWLCDVEDQQLSRNVQRNVQLLTKRKDKKGLLTLDQKGILCKPAEDRTEDEKLLLYKIIGGLKCFRKYPEHVKLQLASVTYFMYYGPNRVIVKQNHDAHALYFIITGEVDVSVTTADPVTKEYVTAVIGSMIAGSMFGEVSLLHDIPRTATITTVAPCEFLVLKKPDFDIVLKDSVKKQWDEIQNAMMQFTYFQDWDEVAVRECCIYSKIKPYVRDQTILGDNEGVSTSAYFVLKGKCRLVEHLLIRTVYDSAGKKRYEMFKEPEVIEKKESPLAMMRKTILDEKKTSTTSLHEHKSSVIRQMHPDDTRKSKSTMSSLAVKSIKSFKIGENIKKASEMSKKESVRSIDSAVPEMKKKKKISKVVVEEITEPEPSFHLPKDVETHFMQFQGIGYYNII